MGNSLIIVESPAKVATIKKIVGDDFVVKSSVGHIRDLPPKELGIDIENGFEPRYVTIRGKGKIVAELKKAAKNVDTIFLGMDPDREGEAIAFHVAHAIGKKDVELKRILFNEITPKAVRKSLEETKEIDMEKFYAQQARRVLDRLVGFEISPLLWKVIASGLSAGRVQTVALRIICERDVAIEAFEPKEYWTIEMMLTRSGMVPFRARLHQCDGQKIEIDSQERADRIAAELKEQRYQVAEVKMRDQLRRPSPPFTTSSLQQECARRLRYSVKRTMALAQKLYEGVELEGEERRGLITYMRTDSVRVSDDAITDVRSHIESKIGSDYLPESPVFYKTKGAAQDAHEAIRPTSVSLHPAKVKEWLEPDQWRVYELIWKRFVASQMEPQVLSITTVNISAGKYVLRSSGNLVKFDGFTKLYEASDSDKSAWLINSSSLKVGSNVVEIDGGHHEPKKGDFFVVEGDTHQYEVSGFSEGVLHFSPAAKVGWSDNTALTLPFDGIIPDDIAAQQELELSRLMPQQHETKPPARYTEASLVKELEAQGIGRPSTYAQIITTVVDRGYVERMNRSLKSTELGQTVTKLLVKTFPNIFNVGFTAEMEDKLDRIAEG
ncbi:MAG: type I DNA topoisomerase, partial [Candidatus Latescibacterota bacterium]|nr:type I DNA topoisomerase [Candidatus Latescibacterota bacterium]